ncbi:anthranilate phosphoribosyltransferase [Synechococcus sp. CS-1328]|uniref:anthranilate phosphoribosyltransferase n=1 Tax=Synechococcus sp. CS-1328 TaxID=2847976 RepID=UPI00223BD6B4|nr:anthranilate phosphoribosyltransferase [Synechococcus sp. CS-1328]MCT0226060.1 anthranilate phosphoribosyltransferase [Synechococcus sp. CS-1328]
MAHPLSPPALLEQLLQGRDLSGEQASALMRAWLEEQLEPVQTGALLASLRAKGVSGEELAALAMVLRQACPLPGPRPPLFLVDTCGTGGDGADSFNISTAVAFVAAAAGAHVAKHGNRSASGRVGSADVLEALGLRLQAPQPQVVAALEETGLTFLFAPGWHPALVGLAPLRRSLGVRTVFNLLGPLVNPLRPDAQVLGVARADLLDPMAEALQRLGLGRAVVVYGHGGLDEASLSGPNALRLLENGTLRQETLDPAELGLSPAPLAALAGGDVATNAAILEAVLQGRGTTAQRDVVALNAALVLWAAGRAASIPTGLEQALGVLNGDGAWQRLLALRHQLAEA